MGQIVFVQISDLHFGSTVNCHSLEWIPGLQSHNIRLAEALSRAFPRIRDKFGMRANDHLSVVVTGDLTARGAFDEFIVAHTYLQSRIVRDGFGEQQCGLNLSTSRLLTIPGNHDHWRGSHGLLPAAYAPEIMGHHFRDCPRETDTITSKEKDITVEFISLDTNKGWGDWLQNTNQRAAGEIDPKDVDWLHKNVPSRKPGVIRCLLCHHGFSGKFEKGTPDPRPDFRQLTSESQERLLEIAEEHEVSALLTGHLHRFLIDVKVIPGDQRAWPLHEIRCATTTQGVPCDRVQGFFVHRLIADDNLTWEVHRYEWWQGDFVSSDSAAPYYRFTVGRS